MEPWWVVRWGGRLQPQLTAQSSISPSNSVSGVCHLCQLSWWREYLFHYFPTSLGAQKPGACGSIHWAWLVGLSLVPREWEKKSPSSNNGHSSEFAICKMKLSGHFVPSLVVISHRQLVVCWTMQCLFGLSWVHGSALGRAVLLF